MKLIANNEYILCSAEMRKVLLPVLQFQKMSGFGMSKQSQTIYMIRSSREHEGMFRFPTGYLWKVVKYLKSKEIKYSLDLTDYKTLKWQKPHLPGITFRLDQKNLIMKALKNGRGILHSATATGKTIIVAGIMSAYPKAKILFLVHTTDLVHQTKEALSGFGFSQEMGVYSGTEKNIRPITFATVQSFKNIVLQYPEYFDIVVIDEVHRFSNLDGMYAYVMRHMDAPIKIGVTATLPATQEGRMVLEGLVGPVLGTVSIQEAAELEIIAKPVITVYESGNVSYGELLNERTVPIPEKYKTNKARFIPKKYSTVYRNGIVVNNYRNRLIVHLLYDRLQKGKSILVTIVHIDHGHELMKIIDNQFPCTFVHGKDTKKTRIKVKKDFEDGKLRCVIASEIFTTGINLPHLDVLMIGGGQKAEIGVIQKVGRPLRRTKTKTEVEVIDFDDRGIHHFLGNHSLERFKIYKDNGWIK